LATVVALSGARLNKDFVHICAYPPRALPGSVSAFHRPLLPFSHTNSNRITKINRLLQLLYQTSNYSTNYRSKSKIMAEEPDLDQFQDHFECTYQSPKDSSHVQHDNIYNADYSSLHLIQPNYEEIYAGIESPRTSPLTKEQVDILEAQFRAHPKPDSMTKRQLAIQANLTLPRIAVSTYADRIPPRN
jgi:hypothetical protein